MAGAQWARRLPNNCWLTAPGYGTMGVNVTKIGHGMSVVASTAQSRTGSAFYPEKRTSGSFGLTVKWANYDESEAFSKWLEAYCRRIAHPDTTGVGPMRVVCAARRFDKIAIPSGERGAVAIYGDTFDAVSYEHVVNFEGSRDSIEFTDPVLSLFRSATVDKDVSQFFYPSGNQVGGEVADISDEGWAAKAITEAVGSVASRVDMLMKGIL